MLPYFRRAVLVLISAALLPAAEPLMLPVRMDGPVHKPARHTFWYGPFSECASVLDLDGDGELDIAAGKNWYKNQAGRWIKHANSCDGADRNVLTSGWIFTRGGFRRPGFFTRTTMFRGAASHPILVHDVNQDGRGDIIIGSAHAHGLVWLEQKLEGGKRTFAEHWVEPDFGGFHTVALGDLNGDGLPITTALVSGVLQHESSADRRDRHRDESERR
jgi:hypothetical protein